jgi:hypothetical protein
MKFFYHYLPISILVGKGGEMGVPVARMGEKKSHISVEKPEGKTPLWRPKRRCEDNIKMNRKEIDYENVD